MKVAIVSLSSCLGCQVVLLSLEEYFYTFISENNIAYAPFLIDEKELPQVDLTLVEGTVRTGDDFRKIKEVRDNTTHLVALGTCACFGGVQGLANMFSEESMLRRHFGKGANFEDAPPGVRRLLPLDSYVMIDAFLPGCPPSTELVKSFLELALSGTPPSRQGASVCSECRVSSLPLPQPGPRRMTEEAPRAGKCLLEQGFICMGPLTRDGCGAICASELGIPCKGCRGPSDAVLKSSMADMRLETLRRLSRATGMKQREVKEAIKDPAQSFFKFCLAEPILRRRRSGGTSSFIHRLEGR